MSTPPPGASSALGTGVRFAAVRQLQERRSRFVPGSFAYDIADHAITLALSPRRPTPNPGYLQRNALRDARRVLARAGKRIRTDALTPDTPLGREIEAGVHPGAIESITTPESLAASALLLRCIKRHVSTRLGSRGLRCLSGLLEGESPDESAAALGVSPRTADRVRAQVRAVVRECLADGDA